MRTDTPAPDEDYRTALREAVLCEQTFLRLIASGRLRGSDSPWRKIVVRPVQVKGERRIQFSYFDGKKDTTRNFTGTDLSRKLDEVLSMPFRNFHVQATSGDLHVRLTRKGKALISRGKPSRPEEKPSLRHDREKRYPLAAGAPDDFLQAVGIVDQRGRIRPAMQGKFRQISEFLRLLEQALQPEELPEGRITIVDCGCGRAYLTFAAYHYLRHVLGLYPHIVGIDEDREIVEKCERLRASLGWDELEFRVSKIAGHVPGTRPDVVLSLHACDTATDEAIAQGIRWQSRVILAAPCCQHELRAQLRSSLFGPVLRHGILKQRTADILTDAFRALVLRITGYRADVVEFVDPDHTAKNLMIRAVKALKPGAPSFVQEYQDLKRFWQVEPCLERLAGETLRRWLDAPPTARP